MIADATKAMPARSAGETTLCVVGLVYLEVYLPALMPAFEAGAEHFVDELPCGLGGAINSASVAHALGLDVTLAHPLVEQAVPAAALDGAIARLGLPQQRWPTEGCPAAVSLVQSSDGERAFVSAGSFAALEACPALPAARWIHVPGLYEARALEPQLRAAREAGSLVSVAGSWAPEVLDGVDRLHELPWDVLVLNEKEARRATGHEPSSACTLLARSDRDVVVTAGSAGSYGSEGSQAVWCRATEQASIDSTGAGDAFCAGLIAGRLAERPLKQALDFANRVAARCIGQRGGVAWKTAAYAELATELKRESPVMGDAR